MERTSTLMMEHAMSVVAISQTIIKNKLLSLQLAYYKQGGCCLKFSFKKISKELYVNSAYECKLMDVVILTVIIIVATASVLL
jgi:hypothetical protein